MTAAVSIVVPLFNRASIVAETVRSVLEQTDPDWRLFVVDDGSDDGGLSVVEEFARHDQRIKCWERRSPVRGAPSCRNEGLEAAKGQYVIFLDSDDLLAESCVQRRLNAFRAKPECDCHVFPTELFSTRPGDLGERWLRISDDYLTQFLQYPAWQTTSAIWRTDAVRQLGGFREDLLSWQDWDLHVRALADDFSFQVHDVEADNFCRRSDQQRISKVSEKSQKHLLNRFELFRDTFSLLSTKGKLNSIRSHHLGRRMVRLATKMHQANMPAVADEVVDYMSSVGLIVGEEVEETRRQALKESRTPFAVRFLNWAKSLIR